MTIDIEKYQRQLNTRLHSFSGKFMSNAKWTKLFTKLAEHSDQVKKCLIKDVMDDVLRQIMIPDTKGYTGTFHSKGIKDVMAGGPSSFVQIEQLIFPGAWTIERNMGTEKLAPFRFQQDIFLIKAIIDEVGQLEVDIDNSQLIVYGYK